MITRIYGHKRLTSIGDPLPASIGDPLPATIPAVTADPSITVFG